MTTFTARTTDRPSGKRLAIRPVHAFIQLLYVLVGLAAFGSLYARLLFTLSDPLVSALLTLLAVMGFVVVATTASRRR